jgi:hypothetical protein
MEQHILSKIFPELHGAIENGYYHHFTIHPDGSLRCNSNLAKHYEIDELNIKAITCSVNQATIYLIDTLDGLYKGVLVDYWENYS